MTIAGQSGAVVLPGGFELLSNLGEGGAGSVYLARYLGSCLVAVKVLDPPRGAAADHDERFERECSILTSLRHPAIVTAYSYGATTDRGARHMVMEFVDGITLHDWRTARNAPLSPAEAVDFLLPIADALAYCHSRGVYHRDVSPKNILVTSADAFGSCKLVDFGASWKSDQARVTRGVVFTTTDFQPLERFHVRQRTDDPEKMGVTSDVYALAAVAYFLTSGAGSQGGVLSISQKIGTTGIEIPHQPAWSALLSRALHASPLDRLQSMAELRDRLRPFANAQRRTTDSFWPARRGGRDGSLPPMPIAALTSNRPATTTDPVPTPAPPPPEHPVWVLLAAGFVGGLLAGALIVGAVFLP